jgi:protein SCO1
VIVDHEEIPGFMPAMTMPFRAESADEVATLTAGQAIRFTLTVSRAGAMIRDIERIDDEAMQDFAGSEPLPRAPDGTPILLPGHAVPSFELIDQEGHSFGIGDYAGRPVLLTFIYTRCPIPDYCPLMSRNFQILQPEARRAGVTLLSISFDVEHDTPAVLKEYASRLTDDTAHWRFATGTPEQIAYAATLFGVFYEEDGLEINHSLSTALIGSDGRVREIWRGNRWTPEEVLAVIRTDPAL